MIVGREEEIKTLELMLASKSLEFLAIYGRRRIGKTFLIKEFFKNKKCIFLSITDEKDASMQQQMSAKSQRFIK